MNKKSWKNLISENQFWAIIEESLKGKARYSLVEQDKVLFSILETKTKEELVGFYYHASELYRKALREDLWGAVYIARNGCGDDSFHYFRSWLVRRGKKVYYDALENPDSLIDEFANYKYRDDILADLLIVELNEWYKKKSLGKIELSELIENEYNIEYENKDEMEVIEDMTFSWTEEDEESLKKLCPRLFEKYWGNTDKSMKFL